MLVGSSFGQQPAAPPQPAGFINPSEINLRIEYDVRTLIAMAAINMAGFDYEPGGQQLTPARAELRRDLAGLDARLKEKLAAYYRSHRRAEIDEAVDAWRYAALSLLMTDPPIFSLPAPDPDDISRPTSSIPADLKPLLDFEPLLREFYSASGIKNLIQKYSTVAAVYAQAYRRPVGEMAYRVVEYFHARPETIINMRPIVISDEDDKKKKQGKRTQVARNRTRQMFLSIDPLAAMGGSIVRDDLLNRKDELLYRRVGDDYIVFLGPSRAINTDAVRQALIRFILDPIIERHLKQSLEYKDQIVKLVSSVPTADKQYATSVYLVVRESLARAVEARMRRLEARAYSEDDAVYDLAQAYLKGAALAFHFYEALQGLEKVGISVEEFFDEMLATTKFDREAARAKEFESVVARVAAARKEKAARPVETGPPPGSVAGKILQSDDLIRQKKFKEAKVLLEEILAVEPDNARAVYGLAQVINSTPGPAETDPAADENDKIQQQHDRFKAAIRLYEKAISLASKEREAWLIQWCYVLIGRIYDFQEFRADAISYYEKAIAMGDLPEGAFKEAMEGKQRPYR
jgi:tetratricopeptide (TPR) repeat protein